jgi:hypothetical protein
MPRAHICLASQEHTAPRLPVVSMALSGGPKKGRRRNRHGCGSAAIHRRSRCGSLRGWPVLSVHFSPGWAPQIGQVTARTCSGLSSVFMAEGQYPKPVTGVGTLAHST